MMLHMMFDKKYWFTQKTFGWGATPNTWQGWVYTAFYVGAVIGFTVLMTQDQQAVKNPLWWGGFAFLTIIFLVIAHYKTDGGFGRKGG